MSEPKDTQKCGLVSVIGLPNAGKSTLVNELVGAKVSIVSRKVQTTRSRILGIALHENAQIILIDTPGIFKPGKTLEKAMVSAAFSSFEDADKIIHIIDAKARNPLEANKSIQKELRKRAVAGRNVILALNKIDKIKKEKLLKIAQELNDGFEYSATFMISALSGNGVQGVKKYLAENIPAGAWMYDGDQISDMPVRLMAAEITREKIYDLVHQEIPYSVFVKTESWENFDNGSAKVSQLIYVQKESQKGILLGKKGAKIKAIGQSARKELEDILGIEIHLKTFVQVQENWPERAENYEIFGLDISAK